MHIPFSLFLLLIVLSPSLLGKTILIGRGNGKYKPYEWEEKGEFKGIHIDLVQKAANNLRIPIKFKSFPWKRAVKLLRLGKIDALLFISKNKERERFAEFLPGNVISVTKQKLFVLKKNKNLTKYDGTIQSLQNQRIAIQKGYSYGEKFDSNSKIVKVPVKTKKQLLAMLIKERSLYSLVNQYELEFSMKDDPNLKEVIFLTPPINQSEVYLAFSKKAKMEEIAKRFALEINKLKKSEFFKKIYLKYLGNEAL